MLIEIPATKLPLSLDALAIRWRASIPGGLKYCAIFDETLCISDCATTKWSFVTFMRPMCCISRFECMIGEDAAIESSPPSRNADVDPAKEIEAQSETHERSKKEKQWLSAANDDPRQFLRVDEGVARGGEVQQLAVRKKRLVAELQFRPSARTGVAQA
jgi:hypothetical protein